MNLSRISSVRRADRHRSRDVCGAITVLGAGVDQVKLAIAQGPVGSFGDAVVDDRAVGSGAGNRVETQIAKMIVLAAECLQAVGRPHLGHLPGLDLAGKPGEETGQCDAVAQMRRPCAVKFHLVLAGLWQQAWVGRAHDFRAGGLQPLEEPIGGGRRIDQHAGLIPAESIDGFV